MRKLVGLSLALVVVALAGCATTGHKNYEAFKAADPHSILIVPVVNRTTNVDAPDYFLSTVTIPLAEKGYYVFPVNLVKRSLEDDGLSDADMVHSASTAKLCGLFGSDSVLYVSIERWDARWALLSTTVTVGLSYAIKDCKTEQVIWEQKETMVYTPQGSNSGNVLGDLIADVVTAAIAKAAPNYMPLAIQANARAFQPAGTGIPAGPYHGLYKKDGYY